MHQKIKTKQELVRAIQKPSVVFLDEFDADSEKALLEAAKAAKKHLKAGRKLSLVLLASKA